MRRRRKGTTNKKQTQHSSRTATMITKKNDSEELLLITQKKIYSSRILKLREYCKVIKESLIEIYSSYYHHNSWCSSSTMTTSMMEMMMMKNSNGVKGFKTKRNKNHSVISIETLKNTCKNSVNLYENEYDSLRDQCNSEIKRLDNEIVETLDYLMKTECHLICF